MAAASGREGLCACCKSNGLHRDCSSKTHGVVARQFCRLFVRNPKWVCPGRRFMPAPGNLICRYEQSWSTQAPSAPTRRDRRSQQFLLCGLCAPLCVLCVERCGAAAKNVLQQGRPTANAGGAAATAIQHRARKAERRGRSGKIIATCGRVEFAFDAVLRKTTARRPEVRRFIARTTPNQSHAGGVPCGRATGRPRALLITLFIQNYFLNPTTLPLTNHRPPRRYRPVARRAAATGSPPAAAGSGNRPTPRQLRQAGTVSPDRGHGDPHDRVQELLAAADVVADAGGLGQRQGNDRVMRRQVRVAVGQHRHVRLQAVEQRRHDAQHVPQFIDALERRVRRP